jgi:hypothetical protein
MEENQDPLEYDKLLLTQLNHISDRITNFAITNYAASGAILLAYFTSKLPALLIFLVVLLVNVNFTTAIIKNNLLMKNLYQGHIIARNAWFENKSKTDLYQLLKDSGLLSDMRTLTSTKLIKQLDFSPVVISNLIPAFGALMLLVVDLAKVHLP